MQKLLQEVGSLFLSDTYVAFLFWLFFLYFSSHISIPLFPFPGSGSAEEGKLPKGGDPLVGRGGPTFGNRWVGKGGSCGSRLRGGRFYRLQRGVIAHPHIFSPTSSQESSLDPVCHCLLSAPSGTYRCHTWSPWVCNTSGRAGIRSCLSSYLASSRGRSPHQHAAPLYSIGGIKRVYRCWVEGSKEGPSTLHATISVHVHKVHLGVGLVCPSCGKSFLNPDTFWCHKKSF